jgi:cytochrome b561
MDKHWNQKEKGPSPTLILQCSKCHSLKKIETSLEHLNSKYYNLCIYLIMVAILLTGSIFERTSVLFNILEINTGSKQFYYNTVILDLEKAVNSLLEEF